MIYEYKCSTCGRNDERICKIDERDDSFLCRNCDELMERVPAFGGSLICEHPAWLDHHVQGALQDPSDRRRITTRSEHDRYCKERGIAHL